MATRPQTTSDWFRDETVLMATLRETRGAAVARLPQILGYDDLRELSRGGQGVVFTAVQRSTKRKVAIKLLLDGALASEARRRRFEREVDLAASLRHPHIVRLYDSGITSDGNPYYVMDYIDGEPLDCLIGSSRGRASSSLSLDARDAAPLDVASARAGVRAAATSGADSLLPVRSAVELFVRICDSVNYAHQRGVIHRDLKPSNIRIDRDGLPHVLDFGLAKRTFQTQETGADASRAVSLTGEFLGSLPWASPEQAEGDPAAIDIRTDVYALGVMLYQTLTGAFPYDVRGALGAVLRNIQTAQPAKPSRLRAELGDELDSIVLKCLEKRPEERYQTVGDLGRDLRRYLAGEPIEAKQASAWYTLRKSMWRYRAALSVATLVMLISATSAVVTTFQWQRAVEAEKLAGTRLIATERAKQAEETARLKAERERAKASFVTSFLTNMFATPSTEGPEARIADRLDVARGAIDALTDDPEIEAALRAAIGAGYGGIALYDQADLQLQRALDLRRETLGPEHSDTLDSIRNLAWLRRMQGRLEESRDLAQHVVDARRRLLGNQHPDTAKAHNDLAITLAEQGQFDQAEAHYRAALDVFSAHEQCGSERRGAQLNLALALHSLGRLDEAETLIGGVITASGTSVSEELLRAKNALAVLLNDRGRAAESLALAEEVYQGRRELFGPTHPDTMVALNNLAASCANTGDLARAAELSEQAAGALEKALGANHPRTLTARGNLALWWQRLGRTTEAEALFRRVLAARESVLGPEHVDTLLTMNNLATMLHEQERRAEAAELYERVVARCAERLGAEHAFTLTTMLSLAALRREDGRRDEARALAERVLATRIRTLGEDNWAVADARWELAKNDLESGRIDEAVRGMERVIEVARRSRGADHWIVAVAECTLGRCLMAADRLDEAEALLRGACERLQAQFGPDHRHTRNACDHLRKLHLRMSPTGSENP